MYLWIDYVRVYNYVQPYLYKYYIFLSRFMYNQMLFEHLKYSKHYQVLWNIITKETAQTCYFEKKILHYNYVYLIILSYPLKPNSWRGENADNCNWIKINKLIVKKGQPPQKKPQLLWIFPCLIQGNWTLPPLCVTTELCTYVLYI